MELAIYWLFLMVCLRIVVVCFVVVIWLDDFRLVLCYVGGCIFLVVAFAMCLRVGCGRFVCLVRWLVCLLRVFMIGLVYSGCCC